MSKPDVQQKLAEGVPLLSPLGEMGNALSNFVPIIAPLDTAILSYPVAQVLRTIIHLTIK